MKVLIIVGSESDMHIARKAEDVLKDNKIPFEIHISSAHREPIGIK